MNLGGQVEVKELKHREISQSYVQIEEACEYLNHLVRFNSKILYQVGLQYQSIDQKQMFTLMVQQIYLYYIAHCKRVRVRVSKDIYIKNVTANLNTIHKIYIIEQHYLILTQPFQQYVNQQFITLDISNHLQVFTNTLLQIIDHSLLHIHKYFTKYKDIFNIAYIRKYYDEFNFLYLQMLKPNLQLFKEPRLIMECLQKTQLFRDNSLLITIKPSLVFQKLRPLILEGVMFERFIKIQKGFRNSIEKGNRDQAIELLIKETVLQLLDQKIIQLNISIDTKKYGSLTGKNKIQQGFQGDMMVNKQVMVAGLINQNYRQNQKYLLDGKTLQFYTKESKLSLTKMNFMAYISAEDAEAFQQANKDESVLNKSNQFIMEINYEQQIINIQLVLEENLNLDKLDFILYEANKICEEWYTPTLQIIQNKKNNHNSAMSNTLKTLAFAISFKINPNNHPIAQILTIFDILIVHQKILLKELNKAPFKRDFPYKYNYSNQNIKRMNNLLLSNIEKVYTAQLTQSPHQPSESQSFNSHDRWGEGLENRSAQIGSKLKEFPDAKNKNYITKS